MPDHVPITEVFRGVEGNRLVGDVYGKGRRAALFLHGGGQTRHAFAEAAHQLAASGFTAVSLDQRGHGDSDWSEEGAYDAADFAADAVAVAAALQKRVAKPAVIGASLGGMAAMFAEGEAAKRGLPPCFSALVLVDVTPRFDPAGAMKIQGFMRARALEGFATIDEAADAVAEYLPHRSRPASTDGLRKNLRLHEDGRWRWHWDPRFFDGPRPIHAHRFGHEAARLEAVKTLRIPALLVRGASSELVREEDAREFLSLAPHARFVDVAGARHMVAGDRNDAFSDAIIEFLQALPAEGEKASS
ncbi:MAG TPA: alpha/beta hydrolase [Xanthobacteraceae bacterium]|nr:alpha/beta hydrolase [Xanthobacteraceae bacterium]